MALLFQLLINIMSLWLLFAVANIKQLTLAIQQHSFKENCADEHDKELLSCTVSSVKCDTDVSKLFSSEQSLNERVYPDEAHDLRIEPFAKAIVKGTNKQLNHQLLVDISWQTPPNNSSGELKAFLLEIEGENGRKHECFMLNLSGTNWTSKVIATSPRLHFSTDSLFSFSQNYEIELYSLPERNIGSGASVHTRFITPHNPNSDILLSGNYSDLISSNCSKYSNQFASKWTAGFRHIYLHSAARILQVEFMGAPFQYCFEQYEVRLLDETGLELLYSGTVSVEDMEKNGTLILGHYNFTDLEYDKSYIPSVIPVERAADGRCLCPVFGTDPYDVKVVCSCVAADWKPVRMIRPDVLKLCPGCPLNSSALFPIVSYEPVLQKSDNNIFWTLLILFNILFLLAILCLLFIYFHCRKTGGIPRKDQYRRYLLQPPNIKPLPLCSTAADFRNNLSSLTIRANLEMGTVSANSLSTPLISSSTEVHDQQSCNSLNLLIVYAHDCDEHERTVVALAEFLHDVFHVDVTLDCWNKSLIESNLTDWLSASVLSADKVMIINSTGGWERYYAKITSRGRWVVERIQGDIFDRLFLPHVDMALQHHSIISSRFAYSRPEHNLPMLNGLLQYNLPDNICPLISALFGRNMRDDKRLIPSALDACLPFMKMRDSIDDMNKKYFEEPKWFTLTHHRRACCESDQELQPTKMENAKKSIKVEDQHLILINKKIYCKKPRERESIENGVRGMPENQQDKLDSGIFEWGNGANNDEDHMISYDSSSESVMYTTITQPQLLDGKTIKNQEMQMAMPLTRTTVINSFGEDGINDSGLIADVSATIYSSENNRIQGKTEPVLAV